MSVPSWISSVVYYSYMFVLQCLLLKIHRLRTLLAPEAIPKVFEVWIGVAVLWMGQIVVDALFSAALSVIFTPVPIIDVYSTNRPGNGGQVPNGLLTAIQVLVNRLVVSWILHHILVTLLDLIIPYFRDQRRDPVKELTKGLSRAAKLILFIQNLAFESPSGAPHFPIKSIIQDSDPRFKEQTIHLQRQKIDHTYGGERSLVWNIVIDREALDEMKETLGPSGGFGELGFSVGRDGVRFEAMGVGTSFVLEFDVPVAKVGRVVAVRRKTK